MIQVICEHRNNEEPLILIDKLPISGPFQEDINKLTSFLNISKINHTDFYLNLIDFTAIETEEFFFDDNNLYCYFYLDTDYQDSLNQLKHIVNNVSNIKSITIKFESILIEYYSHTNFVDVHKLM
jgi:hypothetical protein